MLLVILRTDGFFIVCDAGERRSQPEGEEPSHVPESFPFFQYAARGGNDRQGGDGILHAGHLKIEMYSTQLTSPWWSAKNNPSFQHPENFILCVRVRCAAFNQFTKSRACDFMAVLQVSQQDQGTVILDRHSLRP